MAQMATHFAIRSSKYSIETYLQYQVHGMTSMDKRLQTPLHYLCRSKYCTPDLIKAALVGHPDAGTFRGGNKVNHEIHRLGTLSNITRYN